MRSLISVDGKVVVLLKTVCTCDHKTNDASVIKTNYKSWTKWLAVNSL